MRAEIDRVVAEFSGGVHRSVFSNKGIEFKRLREYSPLDKPTAIDDMASSRLSEDPVLEPYSRVPYAAKKISVVTLLDIGDTMRAPEIKKEHALKLFWFLALSAFKNYDFLRVILHSGSGAPIQDSEWMNGEDELSEFFARCAALPSPSPRFLRFQSVYSYLTHLELHDAAVFVISDFSHSWAEDELFIKRLNIREKNIKFIFCAIDEWGEFNPQPYAMTIRDPRSGYRRECYQEELQELKSGALAHFEAIEKNLRSLNAIFIRISIMADPLAVVKRALRRLGFK
ncbi:MAG: hypothetical protein HYV51_00895 [Parcubacteria group bacterium]|nr:hypothetical protein [Parcubacteria group bacterium]